MNIFKNTKYNNLKKLSIPKVIENLSSCAKLYLLDEILLKKETSLIKNKSINLTTEENRIKIKMTFTNPSKFLLLKLT